MAEKILASVKTFVGVESDIEAFDLELLASINASMMYLTQLGVGGTPPLVVNADTLWDDLSTDPQVVEAAKLYTCMKARQLFDPPGSAAAIESLDRVINEAEWRITVAVDGSV